MTNQTEQWRPVPDYEGLYEISSLGRVRSLTRKGRVVEVFLKAGRNKNGLRTVSFRKNGESKSYDLPRMVLSVFSDSRSRSWCAYHQDRNLGNNALANLKWRKMGYWHREKPGRRVKLTPEQVQDIAKRTDVSCAAVAKEFKVSRQMIHHIRSGKGWSWLTGIKFKGSAKGCGA